MPHLLHRAAAAGLTLLLTAAPACAQTRQAATATGAENSADDFRQYGDWTASAIGGGGYIVGAAFTSDPDRLYAWTDVGGAHRSDDGGHSWRNITATLPYGGDTASRGMLYCRDLLTDPEDPDRALIAIGYHWSPRYGIYRTTDAGETWIQVQELWVCGDDETRGHGSVLTRSVSDPDTIWAAALLDGTFVSRDNGDTWEAAGGPELQPGDIHVDRTNPDRVWLGGTAMDSWVSEDRANSEGKLKLPGGLYRTDDAGANWTRLASDLGDDIEVLDIDQDPTNPERLIAIFPDARTVQRSDDGGRTWDEITDGLDLSSSGLNSASSGTYANLTATKDTLYILSTRGDIYELNDAGNGWRVLPRRTVNEPDNWWGATANDPSYDTDWVTTFAAAACLAVNPRNPAHFIITDWYSVYQSEDRGRTWDNTTDGLEVTYIDCLEQDPNDPMIVHMGMADNGYFKSTDGGERFTGYTHDTGISNNIKSLSMPASDPNRVYAVGPAPPGGGWYAGHVFISEDGGLSWRDSKMDGLPAMGESAHRAHTILADDDAPDTVYLTVAQAVGPDGGGVYRSTDGGDTWSAMSEGLPVGTEFFRYDAWGGGKEFALSANGTMLANSIENGLLYRRSADDDGWVEVELPSGTSFNSVRADPHRTGRFYATGPDSGFHRSDDDGQTWTHMPTPAAAPGPKQLTVDRVVPNRIALGTHHGVVLSTDAGDTWTVLDQSLPGRVDWNKGAFAGNRLVVGSGGTGCYWIDLAQ